MSKRWKRASAVITFVVASMLGGCFMGDPSSPGGAHIAYGVTLNGSRELLIENNCGLITDLELGPGTDLDGSISVTLTLHDPPVGRLVIDLSDLPDYVQVTKGSVDDLPLPRPFFVVARASQGIENMLFFETDPSPGNALIFVGEGSGYFTQVPIDDLDLKGSNCNA